jgi:hypothetical protein
MLLVPADTPLTTPVDETVATPVFELDQGVTAAAVPEPVNDVETPTQALNVPEMVGLALMVTA